MEGVPGPSAVIEPRDLRFHVKIVFLVMEIFVFCIQAKLCFVFRQTFVLYSGKSDLLLAFAQWHGVILTEILGKRGEGVKPPPKRETGGQIPRLEYILLCLNKVRKVRLS